MTIDSMPDLLTTEEVAAYLHMSEQYVYKHIKCGDIKARKLGNVWRIAKVELINFIYKED